MLNIIKNTINRVFASGVDSDASAFITATGLSGTTQKSAITTLVKDLKSSGLWSKMKAVYPMVTDNYNLLSYTENYVVGVWNKQNTTVTANSVTAPNGTLTANTLTATAASVVFISQALPTLTNGQLYTVSRYVKAGTKNFCTIGLHALADAYFDLVNLTYSFSGTGAVSASIMDVGDGWRRISATYNWTGSTYNVYFAMASSLSSQAGITVGDYQYTWGAQLEVGTTASTYQPILTTPSAFMASQMKYNLKDARDLDAAFRLTWSGGWTYSATGATPNGTNAYADTKLIPSTAIASVNSNSIGYYSGSNLAETGTDPVNMGSYNSAIQSMSILKNNARIESRVNGDLLSYTTATMRGFFYATRPSASVANLFFNGSKVNTITPNGTFPNSSILLGNINISGAPYPLGYVKNDFRFVFIADGLNDTDSLLLNQITEKYQVALSRGVQAAQSFYYNSAYSNEANTYLYSTQITGTTQVSAINTLINGLKANNLWTKMKAVYPFVTDKTLQADMAAQMKFNLVNPQDTDAAFRLAWSGGWNYSATGATPNGTNAYADTKFNPALLGLDSAHLSLYSRTNSNGTITDIGSTNLSSSGDDFQLISRFSNINYSILNSKSVVGFSQTTSLGFALVSRVLSTGFGYFLNNSKTSVTKTSDTRNIFNIYIAARNRSNVAEYFSNRETAFASIGDGLSDAEAALLYQLVQDYQTTLNRQV